MTQNVTNSTFVLCFLHFLPFCIVISFEPVLNLFSASKWFSELHILAELLANQDLRHLWRGFFLADFRFQAERKKSRAELKIFQLELWLEQARFGLITKGGFFSEGAILQIFKIKMFQKPILSLKFEFVVYCYWREIQIQVRIFFGIVLFWRLGDLKNTLHFLKKSHL